MLGITSFPLFVGAVFPLNVTPGTDSAPQVLAGPPGLALGARLALMQC